LPTEQCRLPIIINIIIENIEDPAVFLPEVIFGLTFIVGNLYFLFMGFSGPVSAKTSHGQMCLFMMIMLLLYYSNQKQTPSEGDNQSKSIPP